MPNRLRVTFEKLSKWEYWPFDLIYFPVYVYYIFLSIKLRSFFFFTAANPTIEFGGMFGEKKSDIFRLVPENYLPKWCCIDKGDLESARAIANEMSYPLIAKPDIGERGIWVEKIEEESQLIKYVQHCPVDFLIQEYVDFPIELGVFVIKKDEKVEVTSIVKKEFLKIVGDGKSDIKLLFEKNLRGQITGDSENPVLISNVNRILAEGEELMLEPIGNHCRGTTFLDATPLKDDQITEAFSQITNDISGFNFGRFDLRCRSFEDLKNLQNFKILEVNGAGSEPGHIYQPGYSLLKAYKVIFWHLKVLADISQANHLSGSDYWTFKQGFHKWRSHKKYNRILAGS
jgi:hypothetical protein